MGAKWLPSFLLPLMLLPFVWKCLQVVWHQTVERAVFWFATSCSSSVVKGTTVVLRLAQRVLSDDSPKPLKRFMYQDPMRLLASLGAALTAAD